MSEMKMDNDSISGLPKALVKGVSLVDIVAEQTGSIAPSALIEASGLPRGTALRLLDALVELGLLIIDADGAYDLGSHLAHWGSAFRNRLDVAAIAAKTMHELREQTLETVYLGIRDGQMVSYVGHALSPQAIRPAATTGARNPLYSTGIGKILLAFMAPAERDSLVSQMDLVRRTEHTITDLGTLTAHLDDIAANGYAIDDIENEEGMRCVAAPVRDTSGRTIAAMSLSAPSYRFTREQAVAIAPLVIARADEISTRLGYRPASTTTKGPQ